MAESAVTPNRFRQQTLGRSLPYMTSIAVLLLPGCTSYSRSNQAAVGSLMTIADESTGVAGKAGCDE